MSDDRRPKVDAAWERLAKEYDRLRREEEARIFAVLSLLEDNGCDCDCGHDAESHDADCDRCLACRIGQVLA